MLAKEEIEAGKRALIDQAKKEKTAKVGKLMDFTPLLTRIKLTSTLKADEGASTNTKDGTSKYKSAFAERRAAREEKNEVVTTKPTKRRSGIVFQCADPSLGVVPGTSSRTSRSRIDEEPWVHASRHTAEELEESFKVAEEMKKDGEEDWVVL